MVSESESEAEPEPEKYSVGPAPQAEAVLLIAAGMETADPLQPMIRRAGVDPGPWKQWAATPNESLSAQETFDVFHALVSAYSAIELTRRESYAIDTVLLRVCYLPIFRAVVWRGRFQVGCRAAPAALDRLGSEVESPGKRPRTPVSGDSNILYSKYVVLE